MDPTLDQLAGAVDLFGGLTREELIQGFEDISARKGDILHTERLNMQIDEAIEKYYLVEIEEQELLVVGPAALPDLPDGGEYLPHLIRGDKREIDKMRIGRDVKDKISREIEKEIHKMDKGEVEQLLDVCYDLEMWNEIDVEDVRCELEEVLDNMRKKKE